MEGTREVDDSENCSYILGHTEGKGEAKLRGIAHPRLLLSQIER